MLYEQLARHRDLREAGWHSRGYLPHFDGKEVPQFITCRLFDSVPNAVLQKWARELDLANSKINQITLHKRIEKYLDHGYGEAMLKDHQIAQLVENDLLSFDGKSCNLSAWVVMPNHIHFLATRFSCATLSGMMQSFKSLTSHKANRLASRTGAFWMSDYFDRYLRDATHYIKTIEYIENNPVKARLCLRPEDWPFSSARRRAGAGEGARVPSI